jgi:hypothetical protein
LRIGIYDVDACHRINEKEDPSPIPNLALMKISAFHKAIGDDVEFYLPIMAPHYEKIYASKIFDTTDGSGLDPKRMIIGGTGCNLEATLPSVIEEMAPDYSLYRYPHSIGFSMRGCRYSCSFCVVPEKEGRPRSNKTIEQIWTNRDSDFVVLLDNDFFGNPEWQSRIDEIREYDLTVCFSQGLNIRVITDEQANALATIRFSNLKRTAKQVYFAWDNMKDESRILSGIETCLRAGLKRSHMAFYVLIGYDTTPEEDYHRVMKIRELGLDPFVMKFNKKDPYQIKFARWVNHKAAFKSTEWENYDVNVRYRK